jgi:RNA polymerase sigma factor (sigma-70 family)
MGNETDFIRIIKENEGIIFKITTVYSADRDDRQDLYQEIVYQLWKSFDAFRNASKRSTWLYRVALNTSLTHLNKAKKAGNKVPIDDEILNLSDQQDQLTEERIKALYTQIRNLDPIEKAIVLLYLEGKNYTEIAAITGFSVTNTGTRLTRIKQKLKAQIKTDQ